MKYPYTVKHDGKIYPPNTEVPVNKEPVSKKKQNKTKRIMFNNGSDLFDTVRIIKSFYSRK